MYPAAPILVKRRLILQITEMAEIPDAFVIGSRGGNFGNSHNLVTKGYYRINQPPFFPIL